MPLYIGDYLKATAGLDAERSGCYLHWLMHYWSEGPLPNDIEELAVIGKLRSTNSEIIVQALLAKYFFKNGDGHWHQKRIDSELSRWSAKRGKRSLSGAKGATAKWGEYSAYQNKINRSERLANARLLARHSDVEWQTLKLCLGCRCLRCGHHESEIEIVKDHIIPIYRGGSDGIENIQPLCRSCNAAKGPDDSDLRPLDWRERLTKCLANACPSPSPSPIETNTTSLFGDEEHLPSLKDEVIQKAWDFYKQSFAKKDNYGFSSSRRIHAEKAWKSFWRKAIELGIPSDDRPDTILGWWCEGIQRLRKDPFHNGKNENRKNYNDWENLFSGEKWKSPDKLTDFWLKDYEYPKDGGGR